MNPNNTPTTVLGDPDKIEAIKAMGRGALSKAFRLGCDTMLSIATDDIQILETRRTELEEQRKNVEGELSQINTRITSIHAERESTVQEEEEHVDKFEYAMSEYLRCSPLILYKGMTQLCEYLAGLLPYTEVNDVRAFYTRHSTKEPTVKEVNLFLESVCEEWFDGN